MNKTETRYADQLELMKRAGQIVDYRFEGVRFRLAEGAIFKPDFFVVHGEFFEVVEIKGGLIREAALVRFKVAADMYPWFRWKMLQFKNQKEGWKTVVER